jgi:hypothetical protein
LRGSPPLEIKEELLELLGEHTFVQNELRSSVGLLSTGTVLQRLVIRGVTHAQTLSMATITKIQDEWIGYFERSLSRALGTTKSDPPRLEAVHAAVGSFALELKISGHLNPQGQRSALDIIRGLEDLQQLDIEDQSSKKRARESLSQLTRLISLLTVLKEHGARLDVEMCIVGNDRSVEVFITPPTETVLQRLQQIVACRVDSEDVPQADALVRVFELVKHVVRHATLPSPEEFDADKRQVNYYRRAAEILGYLSADRTGLPTHAASYIARASREARLRHALQRFEVSNVGNAWLSWAECSRLSEVDPETAEAFLLEISIGLSPDTIKRRAKTLRSWYEALRPAF